MGDPPSPPAILRDLPTQAPGGERWGSAWSVNVAAALVRDKRGAAQSRSAHTQPRRRAEGFQRAWAGWKSTTQRKTLTTDQPRLISHLSPPAARSAPSQSRATAGAAPELLPGAGSRGVGTGSARNSLARAHRFSQSPSRHR